MEQELREDDLDIDLENISTIDPSDIDHLFEEGNTLQIQEDKAESLRETEKQGTRGSVSNILDKYIGQPIATVSVSQQAQKKETLRCFPNQNEMCGDQ